MKSIAQETREQFNFIKCNVKKGIEDVVPYLSGTSNKRTRMYKEISKYEEYAKIDFELGIINESQYEVEIKSVRIFEKALANFKEF